MRDRAYDAVAGLVCLTLLTLGLAMGRLHAVGGLGVETDFYGSYAVHAENILRGRPYTYPYNPPGYPLLVALAAQITGDLFTAGKLITAVAAALFGWVAYLLLKALFGARLALPSLILTAVALIPFSFQAATDVVGALAMLIPLWLILRQRGLTAGGALLAGMAAGIAYLVRANAIFVVVGVIASLIFINWSHEGLRRRIRKAAVFACGVCIVTLPWFVYNARTNGSAFASGIYLQIAAHFFHPDDAHHGTSVRAMSGEFSSLSDVLIHDPIELFRRYIASLASNAIAVTRRTLRFPAYLVGGIGALLLIPNLSRRRLVFVAVCSLGFALMGLVNYTLRYFLFLFPLLFLLVAYPLFQRDRRAAAAKLPRIWIATSVLAFIVLAAVQGVHAYRTTRSLIQTDPVYLVDIADFLKRRSSPDDVVLVRKPHLAYLAGLRRMPFPLARNAEEFRARAEEGGARYVVYSDHEASLWEGLHSLSDPTTVPPGFTLIYRHEPTGTLIYELDGAAGGA